MENCSVEVGVALSAKASGITSDWIARATMMKVNVSCSLVNQDRQCSDLVSSKQFQRSSGRSSAFVH